MLLRGPKGGVYHSTTVASSIHQGLSNKLQVNILSHCDLATCSGFMMLQLASTISMLHFP